MCLKYQIFHVGSKCKYVTPKPIHLKSTSRARRHSTNLTRRKATAAAGHKDHRCYGPLPVTVSTRKYKGSSSATVLTRVFFFFSLGLRKKGTMTLKPNPKPVGIAERSIFMLGFFFGGRKSSEQILKAKEINGKVTKAGKVR